MSALNGMLVSVLCSAEPVSPTQDVLSLTHSFLLSPSTSQIIAILRIQRSLRERKLRLTPPPTAGAAADGDSYSSSSPSADAPLHLAEDATARSVDVEAEGKTDLWVQGQTQSLGAEESPRCCTSLFFPSSISESTNSEATTVVVAMPTVD